VRVLRRGALRRGGEHLDADVKRHVRQVLACRQGIEKQPRLAGCARSDLDERPGAAARRDLACVFCEQGFFGPTRVVLRQLGDLLEEQAALLVVEPLRGSDGRGWARPCRRSASSRSRADVTGVRSVMPKRAVTSAPAGARRTPTAHGRGRSCGTSAARARPASRSSRAPQDVLVAHELAVGSARNSGAPIP
jgi:hypothetical protein